MMIHFRQPGLLLLGLLLLPLLWWWLRQRRATLRHPLVRWLPPLFGGRARQARWGGTILRLIALTALVVAAAEPRWPDRKTRLATEGIAILMVVDVSGSMATPDFDWQGQPISRLEAVKHVFRLFVEGGTLPDGNRLEGRPTDLLGLVVFGTRPDTICPLTLSHSALLRLMEEQQPRAIPGESETNLSDALALGLHRLKQAGAQRKIVILLSDGEHNVATPASGWKPGQVAQLAASQGIPVYTIDAAGLGQPAPEAENRDNSLLVRETAMQIMQNMAQLTGASYFRAENTGELVEIYRQIDRKERQPILSFQYRRYHEGAPLLGLISLSLFSLLLLLEFTWWRRLP